MEGRFQYPLFRIVVLSVRLINHDQIDIAVSISALSDRCAQLIGSANVSPAVVFQYPLFRIVVLSIAAGDLGHRKCLFQYPLFRIVVLSAPHTVHAALRRNVSISALSDRCAQLRHALQDDRAIGRFNIRSFGSLCSATERCRDRTDVLPFQYPLFRIVVLSAWLHGDWYAAVEFQYPLFRIVVLSK